MPSVQANGVELGVESFGRDADPLVLLAGGTTMLSWPDALCARLAAGGRRVVRYDLRDSGESTTARLCDPAAKLTRRMPSTSRSLSVGTFMGPGATRKIRAMETRPIGKPGNALIVRYPA